MHDLRKTRDCNGTGRHGRTSASEPPVLVFAIRATETAREENHSEDAASRASPTSGVLRSSPKHAADGLPSEGSNKAIDVGVPRFVA